MGPFRSQFRVEHAGPTGQRTYPLRRTARIHHPGTNSARNTDRNRERTAPFARSWSARPGSSRRDTRPVQRQQRQPIWWLSSLPGWKRMLPANISSLTSWCAVAAHPQYWPHSRCQRTVHPMGMMSATAGSVHP